MLRIVSLDQAQRFITRKAVRLAEAEQIVAPILEDVRRRGDEAVLEYARKFDGLEGADLAVPPSQLKSAVNRVSPEFRKALETGDTRDRKSTRLNSSHANISYAVF